MCNRKFLCGRRNKGFIAQVREEVGSFHGGTLHQIGKLVITTFHLTIADKCPLTENDGMGIAIYCHQTESIAPKDVTTEDKSSCIHHFIHRLGDILTIKRIKNLLQTGSRPLHIILQNIYAIDTAQGLDGITFQFLLTAAILTLYHSQFPTEYLHHKVAVTASRFQKP